MKKITTDELEILFTKIIKKLNSENISEISISDDFYRFIPTDEWQSYDEDIALSGSLFDDVDCLKEHIENEQRPFTYVDFDRIASILRYISEKQNPTS